MKYHTTNDGRKVPLSGMSDTHIINTIRCFSAQAATATEEIEQATLRSRRAKALYGTEDKFAGRSYPQLIERLYDLVGPYVLEAVARGLDVREIIVKALGRDAIDAEAPKLPPIKGRIVGKSFRIRASGEGMADSMEFSASVVESDDEDEDY